MNQDLDLARQQVDQFLQEYFDHLTSVSHQRLRPLYAAMAYSVLQNGKRMRPLLAIGTAHALGYNSEVSATPFSEVLPFAAAVELIHTYSLIHDDLPSMDNDDFRRGLPTNHKKFGEAMAVLAGDGLQAQAFELIAQNYRDEGALAAELILLLAKACGPEGMVGGQALDILFRKTPNLESKDLEFLHSCKTGALIAVSVMGPARILGAKKAQLASLQAFSHKLGLAFQVADDVIDFAEQDQKIESANFVSILGLVQAKSFCDRLIVEAIDTLTEFGEAAQWLKWLANDVSARANKAVLSIAKNIEAQQSVSPKVNAGELSGSY